LDLGDRLHGLPTRGSSYEGWVRTNQKNIDYIRRRRPLRARDNKLLDRLLDDGLSRIKIIAQEALYTNVTTPAHGDVCAQNVIFDGSNTSLHLVDWENFGLWDPAAEIALIFEGFGLEFQPNQENEFLDCYCGLREDNTLLERLDAFRPLVRFEQLTWGVKHVLEIAGGDMDKAFVERTDMDKHMTFVDSCIKKCSETYLIDVSPERARELTILPPTPSQL
jgi:thiamine kinase-like enzyme